MDTIEPVFLLSADGAAWSCDTGEWSKVESIWAVHHLRTHCIFQIDLPEGLRGKDKIGPLSFRARLVHVCDGHDVPSNRRQQKLAREAIVYFCIVTGLLDADDDDNVPF